MAYLTEEERKESFVHHCGYHIFSSCVDLSQGVKVTPIRYFYNYPISKEQLAKDTAIFIAYWMNLFYPKLNGFSGLDTIKWTIEE